MSRWTLFSNHGHVLVVLSRDPDARLRDVAQIVGITERAVQKIVRDLQDGGLVSVTKQGRRNRYRLHRNQPLRHTLEAHCTTGELLEMVNRHAPGMEPPESAGLPAAERVRAVPEVVASRNERATPAPSAPPPPAATRGAYQDSAAMPESDVPKRAKRSRKPKSPSEGGDQGSLF